MDEGRKGRRVRGEEKKMGMKEGNIEKRKNGRGKDWNGEEDD